MGAAALAYQHLGLRVHASASNLIKVADPSQKGGLNQNPQRLNFSEPSMNFSDFPVFEQKNLQWIKYGPTLITG